MSIQGTWVILRPLICEVLIYVWRRIKISNILEGFWCFKNRGGLYIHWRFHGLIYWGVIFLSMKPLSPTNLCLLFSWELKDISFSFELPAKAITHEVFVLLSPIAYEIQHSTVCRDILQKKIFFWFLWLNSWDHKLKGWSSSSK